MTDLAVRTPGLPLIVHRLYNSAHPVDGPLGFGWISSLTSRLYYATYLYAAPSTYQHEAVVTMPSGAVYRFTESGGIFAPPLGRRDSLIRNGDSSFTLTLQHSRSKLQFAASGALTALQDEYGNTLAVTYDGNGRVYQLTDQTGSGRSLTLTWGPNGRIGSVQDSAGRLIQYGYNPDGTLATVVDAANRTTAYSYVPARFAPLLRQIKDHWNRVVTDVAYDTRDRVQSYTENGETYTYTYGYQGNTNLTAKTNSQGQTSTFTFVDGGYISLETPPFGTGGTLQRQVRTDGLVEQLTDAVGVKTRYAYDSLGRTASVTRDYEGTSAIRFDYTYDANFPDRITAIKARNPATGLLNPDWQSWEYDYYPPGSSAPGALNHVYRLRSDGITRDTLATYAYNSRGQITSQTSPTGSVTDYAYDAQRNLASITAPSNNDAGTRPVTLSGSDSLGRVTSVTDPLGKVTTYAYDNLDRLLTVTLPKPTPASPLSFITTYTHDQFDVASGLVFTHAVDANAITTRNGYDQFGQLVQAIDGQNNVTRYTYTRGLLTSIADANDNVTAYAYDAARRLRTITHPDGAVASYEYTPDNLVSAVNDRGPTTFFYYDSFKRLKRREFALAMELVYTYTGQKLTQISDTFVNPSETHNFSYDSSYRVASAVQASRGTISYTYQSDDQVATYAVTGGPTATYGYYPDGSLSTINWTPVSGQFKYRHTLPGQYQSITFPSGQTRNYLYDDQGRLTQLTNLAFGGGNLATYAYGYDLNHATGGDNRLGQRVSLTATVPAQGLSNHLTKYEYDGLYQLTKTTYPNVAPYNGEVHAWTYDGIGNRLTNTVNSTTQTYSYQRIGANPKNWQRLLSDAVNSYTYDPNGNTLTRNGSGGNFTFGWDLENRLTGITGALAASYAYDHQGRRAKKTVTGVTTTYLYEGLDLIRETGPATADYLFGPGIDEPLAIVRGGQAYCYGTDALGSVNLLSNASGAVQRTYLYDAWGQTRSQTGSLGNPFGYTAREFEEAGSLFYRARLYSPGIGRFLSEDPLGLVDGVNVYRYVRSSPVKYADPLGLVTCHFTRRTGTLRCVNDAYTQWYETTNAWSGGGGPGCMNNPACENLSFTGPIPGGAWRMGRRGDTPPPPRPVPRVPLYSLGSITYRTDFQIHDGRGPNSSAGCLVLPSSDYRDFAEFYDQDNRGFLWVD